jgi:hypothetical protein
VISERAIADNIVSRTDRVNGYLKDRGTFLSGRSGRFVLKIAVLDHIVLSRCGNVKIIVRMKFRNIEIGNFVVASGNLHYIVARRTVKKLKSRESYVVGRNPGKRFTIENDLSGGFGKYPKAIVPDIPCHIAVSPVFPDQCISRMEV